MHDLSVGFLLLVCPNCYEPSTKRPNDGLKVLIRWGAGGWLLDSYINWMKPDIPGAKYTSLPQMPVGVESYTSYAVRR